MGTIDAIAVARVMQMEGVGEKDVVMKARWGWIEVMKSDLGARRRQDYDLFAAYLWSERFDLDDLY